VIEEPPLLTIRRQFERPDPDLVARLAGAQTGHLVDAMDGGGAMHFSVKPVDPARAAFVGVALTCQTGPSDNLAIMAAVALAQRGDVIVAAADAFEGTAVIGDNVAWMARNAGVAAIVVDGAVRDLAGLVQVGLPVFARGITPNSCVRSGPGRVGLPVVAAGVAVDAGDVVVGDADGVVVIPRALLPGVITRLEKVVWAEGALQARIGAGLTRLEEMEELLASSRVRWVEG
jgi:4-hydroxy-4-methyl-2-oxoglutarate aldolase